MLRLGRKFGTELGHKPITVSLSREPNLAKSH